MIKSTEVHNFSGRFECHRCRSEKGKWMIGKKERKCEGGDESDSEAAGINIHINIILNICILLLIACKQYLQHKYMQAIDRLFFFCYLIRR